MTRFAAVLHRLSRWVEIATVVPLVAAGAVMVAVVLAATFYRYVLNAPLSWSEELARYLMIWIGLVGASVTLRHGEHIRITAVRMLLPTPVRIVGDLVVAGLIAWFLWVMTVEGWAAAQRGVFQVSPALRVSMMWPLLAVPVAGALMLVQHVLQTGLWLLGEKADPDETRTAGGGAI